MKKTIILLLLFMMVSSCVYAERKKTYNTKTGTVKVKFIGINSFDINNQVVHSAMLVDEPMSSQESTEIVSEFKEVKTCNVMFNIQSEGSYCIKEVFETDQGTFNGKKINVSKNKEAVSLSFVDPEKKNIKKVTYTIYSL